MFNLNKKKYFENFCAKTIIQTRLILVTDHSVSLWVAFEDFGERFQGTYVDSKIDKWWGTQPYQEEQPEVQVK